MDPLWDNQNFYIFLTTHNFDLFARFVKKWIQENLITRNKNYLEDDPI